MTTFHEQMQIFNCLFEVVDADVHMTLLREELQAPRVFLERYFISLVQDAARSKGKRIVTISRKQYIEGRDDPLILYISYQNWQ